MNETIKQRWVQALRSGQYKQTDGALRRSNDKGEQCYCCLGVLTDLYLKEKGKQWTDTTVRNLQYDDELFLPNDVVEWSGLDNDDPDLCVDDKYINLSSMNDSGSDFNEIADVIERSEDGEG